MSQTSYENQPLIISGWSVESGVGVNSFLLSAALEAADRGYRTVLIELDTLHASTSVRTGMTHKTRNLEKWLEYRKNEGSYMDIKDHLLNSKIWLNEQTAKNKSLQSIIEEIHPNFFQFTPSQEVDRFSGYNVPLFDDMIAEMIEQLKANGFEAIFIDLPSEILTQGVAQAMSLSDEIVVMTDGDLAHTVYTRKQLDSFMKEIDPDHFKIVINRVPTELIPAVEKNLGYKAWLTIPEDSKMMEYSMDLLPAGPDGFKKSAVKFLDGIHLKRKRGIKAVGKSEREKEKAQGFFSKLRAR